MTTQRRVALLADPGEAELHGLDGRFAWGEARTLPLDASEPLGAYSPSVVVVLGSSAPASDATVRWLDGPAVDREGERTERLIAPCGEGLWRRAPLPANDSVFRLSDTRGAGVLVAGGEPEARQSAALKLRARGAAVDVVERLTARELERAAIVALVGPVDIPLTSGAVAVLAAGRLLVAPRAVPAFGLMAGVDHLAYAHEDELAELADAAASFPEAFEPIVAMGRLAAEAHRASTVYGRLAVDLDLAAASE